MYTNKGLPFNINKLQSFQCMIRSTLKVHEQENFQNQTFALTDSNYFSNNIHSKGIVTLKISGSPKVPHSFIKCLAGERLSWSTLSGLVNSKYCRKYIFARQWWYGQLYATYTARAELVHVAESRCGIPCEDVASPEPVQHECEWALCFVQRVWMWPVRFV